MHICNDGLISYTGKGTVYSYDFVHDKVNHAVEFTFDCKANCSEKVASVNAELFDTFDTGSSVVLCDIEGDLGKDRAMFIKGRYCDYDFEYWELKILSETDEAVTVTADSFHPCAMIDLPCVLEENCFVIKKGEVKMIRKTSLDLI